MLHQGHKKKQSLLQLFHMRGTGGRRAVPLMFASRRVNGVKDQGDPNSVDTDQEERDSR